MMEYGASIYLLLKIGAATGHPLPEIGAATGGMTVAEYQAREVCRVFTQAPAIRVSGP